MVIQLPHITAIHISNATDNTDVVVVMGELIAYSVTLSSGLLPEQTPFWLQHPLRCLFGVWRKIGESPDTRHIDSFDRVPRLYHVRNPPPGHLPLLS